MHECSFTQNHCKLTVICAELGLGRKTYVISKNSAEQSSDRGTGVFNSYPNEQVSDRGTGVFNKYSNEQVSCRESGVFNIDCMNDSSDHGSGFSTGTHMEWAMNKVM